jgi:hypothetical protein
VARALDGLRRRVEGTLGKRAVVVRTAVLDRVQVALGVEDADFEAVDVDDPPLARRQLVDPAYVDGCSGFVQFQCSKLFLVTD